MQLFPNASRQYHIFCIMNKNSISQKKKVMRQCKMFSQHFSLLLTKSAFSFMVTVISSNLGPNQKQHLGLRFKLVMKHFNWIFLVLSCISSLYTLDINTLLDLSFANIFSHSVGSFVDGFLHCQNISNLV